jgi:hypothetical protein
MVKNTKELKIIDTVNRITTTVEKIPNLKLLILFGSRARGEHLIAIGIWQFHTMKQTDKQVLRKSVMIT